MRTDQLTAQHKIQKIPFRLSIRALSGDVNGEALHEVFSSLREELGLRPDEAYNMILYHGHMVVIPRRSANIDGVDANAAGMTGVVWCSSEDQYQEWLRRGPMQWLKDFGVPSEGLVSA